MQSNYRVHAVQRCEASCRSNTGKKDKDSQAWLKCSSSTDFSSFNTYLAPVRRTSATKQTKGETSAPKRQTGSCKRSIDFKYEKDNPKRHREAYNVFPAERDKVLGEGDGLGVDVELQKQVDKTKDVHRKGSQLLSCCGIAASVSPRGEALYSVKGAYDNLSTLDKKRYSEEKKGRKRILKECNGDVEGDQKKEKKEKKVHVQRRKMDGKAESFEGCNDGDDVANQEQCVSCATITSPLTASRGFFRNNSSDNSLVSLGTVVGDGTRYDDKKPPLKHAPQVNHSQQTKASTKRKPTCFPFPLDSIGEDLLVNVLAFLDSPDMKNTGCVCTLLRERFDSLFAPTCKVICRVSKPGTFKDNKTKHITTDRKVDYVVEELERNPSDASSITPIECGSTEGSSCSLLNQGPSSSFLHRRKTSEIKGEYSNGTNKQTQVTRPQDSVAVPQLTVAAPREESQWTTKKKDSSNQQRNQNSGNNSHHSSPEDIDTVLQSRPLSTYAANFTVASAARDQNWTNQVPLAPWQLCQHAVQNTIGGPTRGQNVSDREIVILLGRRLKQLERNHQEIWSMIKLERTSNATFRTRATRKNSLLEEALDIEKQQLLESEREVKHLKEQLLLLKSRSNKINHNNFYRTRKLGRMATW